MNKPKFKAGDRVKVVNVEFDTLDLFFENAEELLDVTGTVTEITEGQNYVVEFDETGKFFGIFICLAEMLEKI